MGKLAGLEVDLSVNSAALRAGLDQSKSMLSNFGASVSRVSLGVQEMARATKKAANEVAQAGLGLAAVAGGAVALAATVDKGIAAEVKNLKNAFTDLAVPVAQLVVPAMRDFAEGIRHVADFVAGLSPQTKAMIATFLEVAVAVGGAALVISKVAAAISAVAGIIGAITAGPFVAFVVGIAAIAATAVFLHKVWRENWGGIQEMAKEVATNVRGYFGQAFSGATALLKAFVINTAEGFKVIVEGAEIFAAAMGVDISKAADLGRDLSAWAKHLTTREGFNGLVDDAVAFGGKLKTGMIDAAGALKDELKIILDGISLDFGKAGRHGGTAGQGPSSGMDAIADISMQATEQRLANEADAAKRFRDELDSAAAAAAANTDAIMAMADASFRTAREAREAAEASIAEQAAAAAQAMQAAIQAVVGSLRVGANIIASRMGEVGQIINSAAQGFSSGGPWGAIIAVIAEFVSRLQVFTQFTDMLNAKLEKTLGEFNNAAKPLFAMLTQFSDALSPLREVIHSVVRLIFNVITPIVGLIGGVFRALQPIFKSLSDMFDGLGTALGAIIEIIVMTLEPVLFSLGLIFKVIGATINFAALGIMGIALGLVRAVQEIIKAFGGNFTSIKKLGDDIEKKGNEMLLRQKQWDLFGAPDAPVNAPTVEPLKDLGDAATNAADGVSELAKQFGELAVNLPNGYKGLNAARFAADGTTSGPGVMPAWGSADAAVPVSPNGKGFTGYLGDVDYSKVFDQYGSLTGYGSTDLGGSGGTFVPGQGENTGPAYSPANMWTTEQLEAFLTAYMAALSAGASEEQATQAGTIAANNVGAGGATGGGPSLGKMDFGAGSGTSSDTPLVIQGDLIVHARDLDGFVKKVTATQDSHRATRRRNPHKAKK